jgi:ribosomal protein L11 methylase PrmA
MADGILGGSFRDPSGFVFEREGSIFRQVNQSYAADYDRLMSSGLYDRLTSKRLLIAHQEVEGLEVFAERDDARRYRTLLPEQLDFVSYPYEWCFSQLKDAALATLRIQRMALKFDMSLKDASAYNMQFQRGRPLFIDTLSFGSYREGEPWVGYRQFCGHFLAPLALASYRDVRLAQLLRIHLDGIPLDLAASLLPARSWLDLGLLLHIRLHARYQRRYADSGRGDASRARGVAGSGRRKLSKSGLVNLIRALEAAVRKLDWAPAASQWSDYYAGDSYEAHALECKQALVAGYLEAAPPKRVWDLGSNTGVYSRIAADAGAQVVSFDLDPACVERNYRSVRERGEENVLPLLLDLANPSPAVGWANRERASLAERKRPDVLLALALVHHLAVAGNLPLARIAAYFAELADALVIEFVPKSDLKVQQLLATREDVFPDYHRRGFEAAFARCWQIVDSAPIEGSERMLYRMQSRRFGDAI